MIKKIILVTSILLLLAPVALHAYGAQTTKKVAQNKIEHSERTDCYDMCTKHLYPDNNIAQEDVSTCLPEVSTEFERTSCYDMCSEHLNR